jgi:protein-S-isoprenylcysteine O-methyltransferase Ste14
MYGTGFLLMAWALIILGRNYQLGGSTPRDTDEMVIAGPYRFVRHPMYLAALCISLGLALLVQSLAFFFVFCIYLVLILSLMPIEEVEHVYFYSVSAVGDEARRSYLQEAYRLGKEFSLS